VASTAAYLLIAFVGLNLLGLHTPTFGPRPLLGVGFLLVSVTLGLAVGDTLYFVALQKIGVARAMPLSLIEPLLATLFAVAFLGEVVTVGLLVGLVLVPAGLYLVSLPARGRVVATPIDRKTARLGVALGLATAVCWALSAVTLSPGLDQVDVLTATTIKAVLASVLLAALARRSRTWFSTEQSGWPRIPVALAAGMLTAGSFFLFAYAIGEVGAARTTILGATSPLYAIPLAALLLREHVNTRMVVGTTLTVAGIAAVVGL
jgi:drug/metabolite transporter (DMT)-like permease